MQTTPTTSKLNNRRRWRGGSHWAFFRRFDSVGVSLRRERGKARGQDLPCSYALLESRGLGREGARTARISCVEASQRLPMFFYHSGDDESVPYVHFALYKEKPPRAIVHEFDGRGHQFDDDLSEVAQDI
jgi:hypothetical protein